MTKQKVDNYWKKELESDKKQILEGKWLNDKHVNAVNNLLQKQHPNVNGLQDPLLLYERQQWRSSCDNFVQIICVARQHFVCASNIKCPPGVVDVYDSLPSYSVKSSTLRKQLAAIVRTDKSAFQVRHIAVQRQSGTTDCGLFSIAFAVPELIHTCRLLINIRCANICTCASRREKSCRSLLPKDPGV